MTLTPARCADHLESMLDDLLGRKGEQDVAVPNKVCIAILTLLQYITEDLPDTLPQELRPAAVHINNALGDPVRRHNQAVNPYGL
jgi:hypothetical protein